MRESFFELLRNKLELLHDTNKRKAIIAHRHAIDIIEKEFYTSDDIDKLEKFADEYKKNIDPQADVLGFIDHVDDFFKKIKTDRSFPLSSSSMFKSGLPILEPLNNILSVFFEALFSIMIASKKQIRKLKDIRLRVSTRGESFDSEMLRILDSPFFNEFANDIRWVLESSGGVMNAKMENKLFKKEDKTFFRTKLKGKYDFNFKKKGNKGYKLIVKNIETFMFPKEEMKQIPSRIQTPFDKSLERAAKEQLEASLGEKFFQKYPGTFKLDANYTENYELFFSVTLLNKTGKECFFNSEHISWLEKKLDTKFKVQFQQQPEGFKLILYPNYLHPSYVKALNLPENSPKETSYIVTPSYLKLFESLKSNTFDPVDEKLPGLRVISLKVSPELERMYLLYASVGDIVAKKKSYNKDDIDDLKKWADECNTIIASSDSKNTIFRRNALGNLYHTINLMEDCSLPISSKQQIIFADPSGPSECINKILLEATAELVLSMEYEEKTIFHKTISCTMKNREGTTFESEMRTILPQAFFDQNSDIRWLPFRTPESPAIIHVRMGGGEIREEHKSYYQRKFNGRYDIDFEEGAKPGQYLLVVKDITAFSLEQKIHTVDLKDPQLNSTKPESKTKVSSKKSSQAKESSESHPPSVAKSMTQVGVFSSPEKLGRDGSSPSALQKR